MVAATSTCQEVQLGPFRYGKFTLRISYMEEERSPKAFVRMRKALGWTQVDAAKELGYKGPSGIAAIEQGQREDGLVPQIAWDRMVERYSARALYVPHLGSVPAGPREWSEDDEIGRIKYERRNLAGDYFALTVRGFSMRTADYLDGDIIIVRSQQTADPGAIVVARYQGEATMKRLRRAHTGEHFLEGDSDPVYPEEPGDLVVVGVVNCRLPREGES